MGHHHADHNHRSGNITLVFFINLVFTIIEFVGGWYTNSIAITSDALHDFGDTLSLGLSWYMERVAKRKRDRVFSFGYRRFSLLAALINGVILLTGSLFVLAEAASRLAKPEEVDANGMLGLAVLGIAANGFAAWRMRSGKSMNESMLSLHLLEDVLGWVAVLVVGIAMKFGDFPILDSVLSLAIAAFIIFNAVKNLKKTFMIFLQSIPDDINVPALESALMATPNVVAVHDTHVWSLDGEHHILTTHLVVPKSITNEDVQCLKSETRKKIAAFDIQHVTLEIEFEGDACSLTNCDDHE
jgi:cobalt-zinc-cadmium efflux system protein